MTNAWQNFGDVSPWHGQTWIKQGGDDYAECVEVITDLEGLAENQVLVEFGSIYISPQWADWEQALDFVGFDFCGPPDFMTIAYAFHAYRGQDVDYYQPRQIVQIGREAIDGDSDMLECLNAEIVVLHGDAKLKNYVSSLLA